MSEPLTVRLSGATIGQLRQDGSFLWNESELNRVPLNAPVLSHSLPFGVPPRDPAPFFGGLLPEGAGLERLARESRVASNDLYGLLAEVGADVGGSVTIGEPRPPLDPIIIAEEEYDRILERAYGYLRGVTVGGGGSSATGVQAKVALTRNREQQRWLIGRGSTPSTHLLKPVANEHASSVCAEAYLNAVAFELGLSKHEAWVEKAGERTVLIIERYDRVIQHDKIQRLHQEDAAQALGLPWGGNDKYESVNPRANLRAIAALLDRGRSIFTTEQSDRERLLMLTVLNVVAGNTDAHAKNFSLMLPPLAGGEAHKWAPRLADAYDIVPQSFFEAEQSPLALRVNGRAQPDSIDAETLIAEGISWSLDDGHAERVVASTLSVLQSTVGRLDPGEAVPALPRYLLERVENLQRGDQVWTRALPPALSF